MIFLRVLLAHHDTMHLRRACSSSRESLCPPRRWCRAGRGPACSPGQSRCRPDTPHRVCRGRARSASSHHDRVYTRCTARTGATGRSWSRRSCTHTQRRWSQCRGSACAWDPCTLYTSDTSLCDWMSQRTSRLEKRDRENSSEWQDNYNLTVCC